MALDFGDAAINEEQRACLRKTWHVSLFLNQMVSVSLWHQTSVDQEEAGYKPGREVIHLDEEVSPLCLESGLRNPRTGGGERQ